MKPRIQNIKANIMTNLKESIKVATLALVITLGVTYAYAAWVGPVSVPPDNNADAPINVGAIDQIKDGGFGVNSLAVFGNGSYSGSVKIGTTAATCDATTDGTLRYNSSSKVMEYCDGSSWTALGEAGGDISYTGPLVNGIHTADDCTNVGGVVYSIGDDDYICRFNYGSNNSQRCFSAEWTQYQNWSLTSVQTCVGTSCNSCTTGSHSTFEDTPIETCAYQSADYQQDSCGNVRSQRTCEAYKNSVGCY